MNRRISDVHNTIQYVLFTIRYRLVEILSFLNAYLLLTFQLSKTEMFFNFRIIICVG